MLTVPAAIVALVGMLTDAGLPAQDGPAVTDRAATEVVAVGWAGADDPVAVESYETPDGLAGQPLHERYTIRCTAMVANGSGDQVAARERAYELLAGVTVALAASPTINGTVGYAYLSGHTLEVQQDTSGAVAVVRFAVDVEAFSGG